MRIAAPRCLMIALLMSVASAPAQELSIGVAAPLQGDPAVLGNQVVAGARLAANGLANLEVADDSCSAEGGAAAARRFAAAKVTAAIGFLCTEAILAALPILDAAGIAVITVGARANQLTDDRHKTGFPVFRLAPRADGEREAIAEILPRMWRNEHFAIVDDGTIYARELSETFRNAAERAGLRALFVDTFRPQATNQIGLVGRLARSGATHVFAAGDREDIAVIARDSASLEADLVIAGGETLRATPGEIPLAPGTIMIGLPEWAGTAEPEVLRAFAQAGRAPEGYALPAYAAVEIVLAAAEAARNRSEPVDELIGKLEFATVIGTIRFDEKGDLEESPYRAFRFDGSTFVEMEGL